MIREELYTESEEAGVYIKVSVNLTNNTYEIVDALDEELIDPDMMGFLAPQLFEALIVGLDAKGFKRI